MDTKKKELVDRFATTGREWQPAGEPEWVNGDRAQGRERQAERSGDFSEQPPF